VQGIWFDLEPINFVCFRNPLTNSTILTYPIPPFTTIIGLLESCLGLPSIEKREYLKKKQLIDSIRISIRIINKGHLNKELTKILKLKVGSKSSPIHKEFIAFSKYRIYIYSEDSKLLEELFSALHNPLRPPYLGLSDDLVSIDNINLIAISKSSSFVIDSIGFKQYPNTTIMRIPWKFNLERRLWTVQKILVSIPLSDKIVTDDQQDVFLFGTDRVELSPIRQN